jgi:hypothetical protein
MFDPNLCCLCRIRISLKLNVCMLHTANSNWFENMVVHRYLGTYRNFTQGEQSVAKHYLHSIPKTIAALF